MPALNSYMLRNKLLVFLNHFMLFDIYFKDNIIWIHHINLYMQVDILIQLLININKVVLVNVNINIFIF